MKYQICKIIAPSIGISGGKTESHPLPHFYKKGRET